MLDPNAQPGQQPTDPSGVVQDPTPSGQPAPDEGQPLAAPSGSTPSQFDPKQWAIKYQGQEVFPKDQEHARALMHKGYSYDQAMSKIARERESLQQEQVKYKKYADLQSQLESDPAFAEYYWQTLSKYQPNQPAEGGEDDPRYTAIQKELGQTKKSLEELSGDRKSVV